MGMEGMGKEKRKIALEILEEVDKIVRLAKMLADEDDGSRGMAYILFWTPN